MKNENGKMLIKKSKLNGKNGKHKKVEMRKKIKIFIFSVFNFICSFFFFSINNNQ